MLKIDNVRYRAQRLGYFIDLVPVDSVPRPTQDLREFVLAHSSESSRTAPTTETRSFIASLRIPAQNRLAQARAGRESSGTQPQLRGIDAQRDML